MGEARSQPGGETKLTHRRTGPGGGGGGGQQVKIWAKPVLKDISMLFYYFEEVNISYFNLKLA